MLYFILHMFLECYTFSALSAGTSLRILDERLSLVPALTSLVYGAKRSEAKRSKLKILDPGSNKEE